MDKLQYDAAVLNSLKICSLVFWLLEVGTRADTTKLIYLLTPRSRVLLEKLTGSAASQEIPRNFWNPKVHRRTHKCPPPVPILSQLHPVPTTPSHFLTVHLNIIPTSSVWASLVVSFPQVSPPEPCAPLSHMCYMPRPPHFSRFYHPHNIR